MTFNNRTPSKAEQEAEARGRNVRDEAGNDLGSDPRQTPINDGTEELGGDPAPRQIEQEDSDEPRGRIKPVHMSPADQKRAEFAKRFKRDDEGNVPYNGNPNDPEMQYGKFGREAEPEPEPEPQPEPQARTEPQPQAEERKHTITVRGKVLHLTDAELLERASKVEAADSYLAESRDLLEQARSVKRNNAERDGVDPHRPEGRTNTQDDGLDRDLATEGDQRPDPLVQAIEEIQFGDPKEAAGKLRQVIATASDENADQRQIKRLVQKDALNAQASTKAFVDQNPEFKDPRTERWMRDELYQIQREEIAALGVVDADKVPTDMKTIAEWHQFYRVHGAKVSDPESMLKTAKTRFETWRGVGPKPAAQQREQRREAPRVEVNVNRDTRRAAIPNQPSRPSAPVPDAVQPKPQGSNRSGVIENMRKARGQLVG
ncbi:hypothetical protein ABIB86_000439 [Bradyrhizobium sp. JR1.7]|uniref:hypothetical protein n=1 Tax=unclassified Bradyrhizobium TaxID=2631580 RepID=UPI003399F700